MKPQPSNSPDDQLTECNRQLDESKRNLRNAYAAIVALLAAGGIAGLIWWLWDERAVGDSPITMTGGSLRIHSSVRFDRYRKDNSAFNIWTHPYDELGIARIRITDLERNREIFNEPFFGQHCEIDVHLSNPDGSNDEATIFVDTDGDGKWLTMYSKPFDVLNQYDPIDNNTIGHPANSPNDKKLRRVRIKRGELYLPIVECPAPYRCEIEIKYTDVPRPEDYAPTPTPTPNRR